MDLSKHVDDTPKPKEQDLNSKQILNDNSDVNS